MEYNFPPDKLLINVANTQFKHLKTLFKTKSKMETLKMHFMNKEIIVTGELNTKVNYNINTEQFITYLNYADSNGEMVKGDNFEVSVPL